MKDKISGYIIFLDGKPIYMNEDLDKALAEYEILYEEEFRRGSQRIYMYMYHISNATLVQSDRTEPA